MEEEDPYRVGCGFKFGYFVFEKPLGVKNAMNKMDLSNVAVASMVENPIVVGVERWAMEYNEQLKEEESIENFMVEYDKKVAEEMKAGEEMAEPGGEKASVRVSREHHHGGRVGGGEVGGHHSGVWGESRASHS